MRLTRPSPALTIATLALVVATSGTAFAVSSLPASSVGTAQLKANAVTGAKVKDRSLSAADIKLATLPFLGASRLVHAPNVAVSTTARAGDVIYHDADVGASLVYAGSGIVHLRNTNASDVVAVSGIAGRTGSSPEVQLKEFSIGPGSEGTLGLDTIGSDYMDVLVRRIGSNPAQGAALRITCGYAFNATASAESISCMVER